MEKQGSREVGGSAKKVSSCEANYRQRGRILNPVDQDVLQVVMQFTKSPEGHVYTA